MQANSFQGEHAVLRETGGDIITDDNRSYSRRHGCNGHPGTPGPNHQGPPCPLKASVTEPEEASKLAPCAITPPWNNHRLLAIVSLPE